MEPARRRGRLPPVKCIMGRGFGELGGPPRQARTARPLQEMEWGEKNNLQSESSSSSRPFFPFLFALPPLSSGGM